MWSVFCSFTFLIQFDRTSTRGYSRPHRPPGLFQTQDGRALSVFCLQIPDQKASQFHKMVNGLCRKDEYIIIGHPQRTNKILSLEPLMLNGAEIKHVKETKSLGIVVDERLNWNEQYRKVKGKVSGGLWALKKLMKIVPQSQLVNIYHALVESHLRYANVAWGSLSNTKLEALQRLQNRAHSIMQRAKIKDQWSGDWLTVEQLSNKL